MKEEIVKKIMTCLYIIIILLAVDTVILLTSNVKISSSSNSNNNEVSEDYDVSMFKEVDVNGAIKAFDSSETQVIYIGRPTCGYCIQFLPILQQAQSDYKYKTLYLNSDELSSEEIEKVFSSGKWDFSIEQFGTPTTILAKDGKIIDVQIGYSEYDSFAKFLEKNGFEK